MTYCTTEELTRLTGSELPQIVLEEIIDQADRQIRGRITVMGVSAPTEPDASLKAASLSLAMVGVLNHPDSSQIATSIKLGDITIKKADIETTAADMGKLAWVNVDNYILSSSQNQSRYYFRKVNR